MLKLKPTLKYIQSLHEAKLGTWQGEVGPCPPWQKFAPPPFSGYKIINSIAVMRLWIPPKISLAPLRPPTGFFSGTVSGYLLLVSAKLPTLIRLIFSVEQQSRKAAIPHCNESLQNNFPIYLREHFKTTPVDPCLEILFIFQTKLNFTRIH